MTKKNGQSAGNLTAAAHVHQISWLWSWRLGLLLLSGLEASAIGTHLARCTCVDVCVCVFNRNNICFLHSLPAAINRWLSWVFDKGRGWEAGVGGTAAVSVMELMQTMSRILFYTFPEKSPAQGTNTLKLGGLLWKMIIGLKGKLCLLRAPLASSTK